MTSLHPSIERIFGAALSSPWQDIHLQRRIWRHSTTAKYFVATISMTLLVYEYLITFSMEVERFWRVKRLSLPVFLFFVNRYVTLLGHIPVMIEYFWTSTSPRKPYSYHSYFVLCVQVYVTALLIVRIYALYDRNKVVLAVYLLVALGGFGVGSWLILSGRHKGPTHTYVLPVGCPVVIEQDQANKLAGAWGSMLVLDVLVFAMTLYKSIRNYRALSIRSPHSPSILTVLLRDGALYFCAMIACNIANILTFVYGRAFIKGVTATLTNTVSSVLISRLMLNLRDPRLTTQGLTYQDVITTVAFRHYTIPVLSTVSGRHTGHSSGDDSATAVGHEGPQEFELHERHETTRTPHDFPV